ncbi:hypothetical protein CPB83DRAFT_890225 [Crepidotus variabilis]|uniref:F-box domain-containing protein n=1 Tax=Crepidotus variabilis TaxID=179855 RepID=A0A9P6EQK6_9AGAR|nr:hypothetical protein CPB83DRAFT_890225 [Crepidotus variabilis]
MVPPLRRSIDLPGLSPFAKFPVELLTTIFTEGTKTWRVNDAYQLPFPILVSSICQHWRLVAHGLPGLWNVVFPPLHLLREKKAAEEWVALWLGRSGTLSISIVMDDNLWKQHHKWAVIWSAAIFGTLEVARNCFERVERLDIVLNHYNGDPQKIVDLLNSMGAGDWPLIQLSLILPSRPSVQHDMYSIRGFPLLRRFRGARILPPNLQNLRSVSIRDLQAPIEDSLDFLKSAPQLETLVLLEAQFSINAAIQQRLAATQPVKLLRLKVLALRTKRRHSRFYGSTGLLFPFAFCQIPDLQYLELDMPKTLTAIFGESLASCTIDKLRLSNSRPSNYPTQSDREFLQLLVSKSRNLEIVHFPLSDLLFSWTTSETLNRRTVFIGQFNETNTEQYLGLKSIMLISDNVVDARYLCQFVVFNPSVEEFLFSLATRNNLANLFKHDKQILLKPTMFSEEHSNVEEWLRQTGNLIIVTPSVGLLERERTAPRGELVDR